MIRAHQFIQALRDAGFNVTTDGEKLWISPRTKLPSSAMEFITEYRPDIITVLEAENAARFIRQRLAEQRYTEAQAA